MKLEHTPEPWNIRPEEAGRDYIRIRGTVLGTRFKIANVYTVYDEHSSSKLHNREVEEARANANLIAAAPEMLEALLSCMELVYWEDSGEASEKVEKAIQKATGKTWEKLNGTIQD